jgi:hypothetical protein
VLPDVADVLAVLEDDELVALVPAWPISASRVDNGLD